MPSRPQSILRTLRPARPRLYDPARIDLPQGLRETMLLYVTYRPLNRALRTLMNIFHEMSLEYSRYWPELPGDLTGWEVRAALGDLRHLQNFLAQVGKERAESEPFGVNARLSEVAEVEAQNLAAIGDRLHRELQAAGVEHWHEDKP